MIRECFWLIVTTKEWDMRQTTGTRKSPGEKIVKDIKPATRRLVKSPSGLSRGVIVGGTKIVML